MESLVSLLVGGIAFETPEQSTLIPAVANAPFTLFAKRSDAMKNPEPDVLKFVIVFNESARGLSPGAPVDFLGIVVGEVAAVKVDFDPRTGKIIIPIDVNIYPDRMRSRVRAGTTAMQ